MDKVYFAARYDKGTADYINCPFTKEEYDRFLEALTTAEKIEIKPWEQIPTHLGATRPAPYMTASRHVWVDHRDPSTCTQ